MKVLKGQRDFGTIEFNTFLAGKRAVNHRRQGIKKEEGRGESGELHQDTGVGKN